MPKSLMAVNAITHKPKTKIERVAPGEVFTPVSDEEADRMIAVRAARELTDDEAKLHGGAKKPTGKKSAPKKETPVSTASADKPVEMDSDQPGPETTDDEMLG